MLPVPLPVPVPVLVLGLVLVLGARAGAGGGCQLPAEWRPLSEGCRAELAAIIVYARVLALHPDPYGAYNYLPWQRDAPGGPQQGAGDLFYSAEIELLCDQAWGSMLEVPAGSRLNLTGLGYFSCHSHTVMQGYSYFFFLRMDENYILLPHGVNFQEAIFPDTQENRRMFASLFQFSNCSQAQHMLSFSSDWEIQEDNRGQLENYVHSAEFHLQSIFLTSLKYHRDFKTLAQHNIGLERSPDLAPSAG
ncbi:hypothetical protein HGM15179_003697 [Zosterops borbonicus]|uniref:CCDC3 protein n=1 Tax=Zosterops borbonicus TaxID=364589 RepID=A0A8K1LRU2_9PASS|nr:hypothetical protein HGM15179_003697 [Zosterops borbonicus]